MDPGTERIKAGGLKILEGGVSLTSSFLAKEYLLGPGVCEPLARNRINLTLLAHVANSRGPGGATLLCTRSADGAASYSLLKAAEQKRRTLSLPGDVLEDLAAGLIALGDAGVRVPFLLAVSRPKKESLFAFSTPREHTDQARFLLDVLLPGREPQVTASVAAISIHGPHFGERWGIAAAFVKALERAEVALAAMSCAVSSISALIREPELARAVSALEETFAVPPPSRAVPRRT